jgi:hypothetical protein
MNQKATYEITITEKLGQLPLPDLRDAIWSRIEAQLDSDMPTDDNNDPGPSNNGGPTSWRGLKIFGSFIAIVAVITIFLTNKNNTPLPGAGNAPAPTSNGTMINKDNTGISPPPLQRGGASSAMPPGTFPSEEIYTPVTGSDSAFSQPPFTISPVVQDTPVTTVFNPPSKQETGPPPRQDTVQKKPRGVKGITDNDYRINLKKDSVP